MIPRFRNLLLCALSVPSLGASPLRVLAIGDSMTEEYAFELPFSAPASDPTNANTRSWPELLRIFRPTEASLGPYESTAFSYGDLRNAGHEWNFGIPGMTSRNWFVLINSDDPFNPPLGESLGFAYYDTRRKLIEELYAVQAVVILIGANDLKQDYDEIFTGTEPPNFFSGLRNRIAAIHDWVRGHRPNVPIVVCTVPDVGATPQISGTYNDPVRQAATRAKITTFNQSLITWAAAKTRPPAVARLDHLTDRLFDESPFHLNGTVFTLPGDPENPSDRVFCRDSFHAATMAQALIANEIIAALNAATGRAIPPFTHREILGLLPGIDPDQPYLDWIAAAGLPGADMEEDSDQDGFPNLAEFLLGTTPTAASRPFSGAFAPGNQLGWRADPIALRFAALVPEESVTLQSWTVVPAGRIVSTADGRTLATPAAGGRGFLRLRALPR